MQSDELVERVARAMAEANKDPVYGGLIWEGMSDDDDVVDYENRDYWRALARAAIDAMQSDASVSVGGLSAANEAEIRRLIAQGPGEIIPLPRYLRRRGLNECDAISAAKDVLCADWSPEVGLQTVTARVIDAYLDYFGLSREDIASLSPTKD